MSKACENRLIAYYTTKRKNGLPGECIQMLPRSLQTLRRLAEASAKLRLSEEVTANDADLAIKVYEAAFGPLMSTEDGRLDADKIDLGLSSRYRDRVKLILQAIRDLSLCDGATLPHILAKTDELSIPTQDAMEIVNRLKKWATSWNIVMVHLSPRIDSIVTLPDMSIMSKNNY